MPILSLCEIFKSVFHVIFFIQSEIQGHVVLLSSSLSSFLWDVTQSRSRAQNLKVFLKYFQILVLALLDVQIFPLHFPGKIFSNKPVRGLQILAQVACCLAMCHSRLFGFGIRNYL